MSEQNDLVKLKVEGMTCTGCAATIEKYLKKITSKKLGLILLKVWFNIFLN